MVPVERSTARLIKKLQKKGVPVIALTARSEELVETTLQQLKKNKIDFSCCGLFKDDFIFTPAGSTKSVICKKNVVFCNGGQKGPILVELLDRARSLDHRVITHVVFADDSLKHVVNVDQALQKNGVSCACFHYTNVDVSKFNPAKAEREFEKFLVDLKKVNPELYAQLPVI